MGLEPTTSGLEVRRAIHCATETRIAFMFINDMSFVLKIETLNMYVQFLFKYTLPLLYVYF